MTPAYVYVTNEYPRPWVRRVAEAWRMLPQSARELFALSIANKLALGLDASSAELVVASCNLEP
jgi:hypothetical protein